MTLPQTAPVSDEDGPIGGNSPRPVIDERLARQLVDSQFPQYADLPISPVPVDGWDNRTYRLGDELTIRMPSGEWYAQQVAKEQRWLPILAPQLPLPIPTPVAAGRPGEGYPYPWSILRWLDGETATADRIDDWDQLAIDLADFLIALRRVDATGGPGPGKHNFFRGGPLTYYAQETYAAIETLSDEVDVSLVTAVWEHAVAATWDGAPVWFHADVAFGNLLVRNGRLSAVIDFGTSGVGDPSADLSVAWTLLPAASRGLFRDKLGVDSGTWSRGRGWTLWKAMITIAGNRGYLGDTGGGDSGVADHSRRVLRDVLADYVAGP